MQITTRRVSEGPHRVLRSPDSGFRCWLADIHHSDGQECPSHLR
ncbi:hypothetical protein RISK_006846 [Rhodopirellula islandica]|uniref:Uncharacterized protein n=1 Tax=Rhodopirellula islandica TaxID=595434 RepID=A0A0J1B3C3_RHOIS|nr:hypothetical protein RISK_006846 [Rhodopirellula islandica]